MPYKITDYSYSQAKKLNNVQIKPSTNKKKKIDVFKNDKKISSIGSIGFFDYPTFIDKKGLAYANERRRLYKKRHHKDIDKKNGFYANKILW